MSDREYNTGKIQRYDADDRWLNGWLRKGSFNWSFFGFWL